MHWFDALERLITGHAGAWWTYALTGALCFVDGFFPPVPSESIVIAMAALSSTHGGPVNLWILWPLACCGAFLGDNTAYWIGRVLPLEKIFRSDQGRARLRRAHELLEQRGAEVLLSARFIPVYRVAINMVAGAVRFPYARFARIDVISTVLWAVFSVGIGLMAGSLFNHHPLLGIVVGVILGFVLGFVIDKLSTWWRERRR